jgi:hypothetical protein
MIACIAAGGAAVGCSAKPERPAPATFPVTGEVVGQAGSAPIGATIEFQPKDGAREFTSMGAIDSQGHFRLTIPYTDRRLDGATEGPHQVVIFTPLRGEGGGERIVVNEEFIVRSQDNHFRISLPAKNR